MAEKYFSEHILRYYQKLEAPNGLPPDVEVMNPYANAVAFELASRFYQKYYHDENQRHILFGINPGRFGAGITGVPFTDPIRLVDVCNIENELEKRSELSSRFMYDMMEAFGGVEAFYDRFYISAVSPLGYTRSGVNLNYYDIRHFKSLFEVYAVREIEKQLAFNISRKTAFSIGKGKNIEFLLWINKKYQFFEEIIPLPHPRWVMQYRLKTKEDYIAEYLEALNRVAGTIK